jgi:hypothetical protein
MQRLANHFEDPRNDHLACSSMSDGVKLISAFGFRTGKSGMPTTC